MYFWYFTWRPIWIFDTFHQRRYAFLYFTWRPIGMFYTLYQGRYAFFILYIKADMHFLYFTLRPICIFDTLHQGRYAFLLLYMKVDIIFWSYLAQLLLEWEMFQTKVVETTKTHFMFNNYFFENLSVFEIIWRYVVEPDRPQMTTRRMRIACCIPKATNTHPEYVLLISFPRQQWLHENASILRYTHVACLAFSFSKSSRPATLVITRYRALVRRTDKKLSAM